MADFTNPFEFSSSVGKALEDITNKTKKQISSVGKRVFRRTQTASRVRTGNFKSNWNFSADQPDTSYTDRKNLRRKSENLRLAQSKISNFVSSNTDGRSMHMTNRTPYGEELERVDAYTVLAEDIFENEIDKIE